MGGGRRLDLHAAYPETSPFDTTYWNMLLKNVLKSSRIDNHEPGMSNVVRLQTVKRFPVGSISGFVGLRKCPKPIKLRELVNLIMAAIRRGYGDEGECCKLRKANSIGFVAKGTALSARYKPVLRFSGATSSHIFCSFIVRIAFCIQS